MMKFFAAAALLLVPGCPGPSTEIGTIATGGQSTGAQTNPGSSTAGIPSTGGWTVTSSPPPTDGTTSDSDDTASSSTGALAEPCGGSPIALCMPADGKNPRVCFCPQPPLWAQNRVTVFDLDDDGSDDLLAWTWGETTVIPLLTTPDGLVAQPEATLPDALFIGNVIAGPTGTVWVLARNNEPAPALLEFTLDGGFTSHPLATTSIPADSGSSQVVGDFDGDGAPDMAEAWGIDDGAAGISVLYDALADPVLGSWAQPQMQNSWPTVYRSCDIDGDGADDLLASREFTPIVLWGNLGSLEMTPGAPMPWFEGGPDCKDMDGDGDLDVFVSHACSDCSALFGGYTVIEQTRPGVLELGESDQTLHPDALGGRTVPAHLFDPNEVVLVSLGRNEVIRFPPESTTNFGFRRPTGHMQWDGGRFTQIEDREMHLRGVVDVDHDGLDELVVATIDPRPGGEVLVIYALE